MAVKIHIVFFRVMLS